MAWGRRDTNFFFVKCPEMGKEGSQTFPIGNLKDIQDTMELFKELLDQLFFGYTPSGTNCVNCENEAVLEWFQRAMNGLPDVLNIQDRAEKHTAALLTARAA
ncbi:hypothetical protein C8R44DRAFT_750525 [Mycena epipterygia]|nr:hypothetical protein C8R44DRAFT_750525 [Mycena epipterygia]